MDDKSTDNTNRMDNGAEKAQVVQLPREKDIRLPISVRIDGIFTREVSLRRTTGYEEDLLRDETGGEKARMSRVSQILSQCTVRMGGKSRKDTGDDHSKDQNFFFEDYQAMTSPARSFAWVRLRQLSHGHPYKFAATCPLCRRHNENLTVNLNESTVTEAPDAFCQEEIHVYEADGHIAEWKLLTGESEYTFQQLKKSNPGNLESAELFPFIVTLDGKKLHSIKELLPLSSEFRSGLRDALAVGGMDLEAVNTCKHCSGEFRNMIPIYHKSFFSPGGK